MQFQSANKLSFFTLLAKVSEDERLKINYCLVYKLGLPQTMSNPKKKAKVENGVAEDYDELLEVENFMEMQNRELQNAKK